MKKSNNSYFNQYYIRGIKQWKNLDGVSSRKEYLFFLLYSILTLFIVMVLLIGIRELLYTEVSDIICSNLFCLLFVFNVIAVTSGAFRLHNRNQEYRAGLSREEAAVVRVKFGFVDILVIVLFILAIVLMLSGTIFYQV